MEHGDCYAFAPKSLPCNQLRIPSVWFSPSPLCYFVPIAQSSRGLDGTCLAPGQRMHSGNAQPSRFNDIRRQGEGKVIANIERGTRTATHKVSEQPHRQGIDHPKAEPAPRRLFPAIPRLVARRTSGEYNIRRPGQSSASCGFLRRVRALCRRYGYLSRTTSSWLFRFAKSPRATSPRNK
jgi:hypothetical protein